MNVPPELVEIVRSWVQKAEVDYEVAVHELGRGDKAPVDIICFLAQQSAEKYLKAFLVWRSDQPPKSHNLGELFGLLPSESGIRADPSDLSRASRFAVEPRYPDVPEPLTREDAEWAVRFAGSIRDMIRPLLPLSPP